MAQVIAFSCDKCAAPASITCKWKYIGSTEERTGDFCEACFGVVKAATGGQVDISPKKAKPKVKLDANKPISAENLPEAKKDSGEADEDPSPKTMAEILEDSDSVDINDFKFDKTKALAKIEKAAKKQRRAPDINEQIIARATSGQIAACHTNHTNITITDRSRDYSICNDCGANLIGGRPI